MQPNSYKWLYLAAGLALRLALLAWGRYQDAHSALPYTDVDYSVFSDAADYVVHGCPLDGTVDRAHPLSELSILDAAHLHCARGLLPATARFLVLNDPAAQLKPPQSAFQSGSPMVTLASRCYDVARPLFRLVASLGDPYARPTYRYTPFLALLLTPIHLFAIQDFGKYLFSAADVLCALLMWLILDGRRQQATQPGHHVHLAGLLWLLNPIPAQISTRGSSEGLVGLTVLLFLYFFLCANPEAPLGMAPVYSVGRREGEEPVAADKEGDTSPSGPSEAKEAIPTYRPLVPESALPLAEWSAAALLSPVILGLAVHLKIFPGIYGVPVLAHLARSTAAAYDPVTRRRLSLWTRHAAGIRYGLVAFATFMAINAVAWLLWGSPFIEHTFTYHLTRRDHRHNFSPYFLTTYLSSVAPLDPTGTSPAAAAAAAAGGGVLSSPLLSFGPQAALVAVLGWKLGERDVVAAMTAQTIAFVAFNKVCTSQYFLWFLWLLPLVWPSLAISKTRAAALVAAWVGSQALWLSQAYLLEFRAQDVFARIWTAGLALLVVHAVMLVEFVKAWAEHRRRSALAFSTSASKSRDEAAAAT
ncbi:GPI mannosyltransferase 1 [Thecaphora frezii]